MTVRDETVKPEHITLRLDDKLAAELRRVALLNDRSVSAETRQALRDYLRQFAAQEEAA